jgi:hypothetical protein
MSTIEQQDTELAVGTRVRITRTLEEMYGEGNGDPALQVGQEGTIQANLGRPNFIEVIMGLPEDQEKLWVRIDGVDSTPVEGMDPDEFRAAQAEAGADVEPTDFAVLSSQVEVVA